MSDIKSEKEKAEAEEHRDERIEKTGQITLQDHAGEQKIHLLTIIGEVEGHENLAGNSKTTKYEHILPELAGKSGKVTIRYTYKNNQYEMRDINGKQEKIYVPFAMLTGIVLDNDVFTNIDLLKS